MLKTTSKFQGVLKMFMLGMLKTMLKTVEIRINHHHTLRCMLKLSGGGPKIRWQTARFDSEFTRVSEVRHMHCTLILANSTVHVCIKNLFIINLQVAYVISILLDLCLLNMIRYVNFTMNQEGHMIHTVYIALALRAKCLWI